MVVSITGKGNKKYYGKNLDEARAKKTAAESKTSKEKLVLERAGIQYQGSAQADLAVGVRTVSKEESKARKEESKAREAESKAAQAKEEAIRKNRENLNPNQDNKVYVTPLSQITNPQDLAKQTAVQQGIPIISTQVKATNQEVYLVQTPKQKIEKQYKESGGKLTGKDLQEYYKYFPEDMPTLQTGEAKKSTNVSALAAGFRETPSLLTGITKGKFDNPYAISQGERQFDSNFQKGLYQTGKLGGYIFNVAGAAKGTEAVLGLRTSKIAYETAKAGGIYEGFYTAAKVGKVGSALNVGVKTGAALGVSLAGGTMAYKVGEKATGLRRNIGLDLKKQSKEYVAKEKEIARLGGLATGTLFSNVASQAAGITYVKTDMLRKGATLTGLERGKNIFAAGFGEGATITYLAQEANQDKRGFLPRAAQVAGFGVLGGLSAGTIDKFIQSKRYGKVVEGAAYATDKYEYAGDVLEESFRGAKAFESVKPVRIRTNTDTFFKSFSAKTSTDTKNMQSGIKTEVSLKQRVNSLVNTKSAVPVTTKTNVPVSTRTNTLVNTRTNTGVTTNTNTLVNTRTNVPVSTNTDLITDIGTKTIVPVTTKINVPVTAKTNTNIDIGTPVDTPVDVPVTIFTPNIPFAAFGGGFGKGFAKGGKKALSKYKPSLLGIARGKKASKTTGLSGFEVRGLENIPSVEKTAKSFKFGSFSVKPQKDSIGMKFKVSKIAPKSNSFGKIGQYFKKVSTKSLL
jgi:hypothetical protein